MHPAATPSQLSAVTALERDPVRAPLTVASATRSRGAPLAAVLIVLVLAALGGISAVLVPELGLDGHTAFATVFFYLFARNEPLMLWVLGAFAALAGVLAMIAKRGGGVAVAEWAADEIAPFRMRRLWILATVVLATTAAGTWLVFHAYPLSMDEYMAGFGARIMISGHRSAPVPEEWWPHVRVLAPLFSTIYTDHRWGSAYLPVYSAIRGLFLAVGAEPITNALLGAVSVVLVGLPTDYPTLAAHNSPNTRGAK